MKLAIVVLCLLVLTVQAVLPSTVLAETEIVPVTWTANTANTLVTDNSVTHDGEVGEYELQLAQATAVQKIYSVSPDEQVFEGTLIADSTGGISTLAILTNGFGNVGHIITWGTGMLSKVSVYSVFRTLTSELSTLETQTPYINRDRLRVTLNNDGEFSFAIQDDEPFYVSPSDPTSTATYTVKVLMLWLGAGTPASLVDAVITTGWPRSGSSFLRPFHSRVMIEQ